MNLIELLFLIVCIWILYVAIDYAWQDVKTAEEEVEEAKKQLNQDKIEAIEHLLLGFEFAEECDFGDEEKNEQAKKTIVKLLLNK